MIDSGADNCPIEMAIDNHTMRVISLDGNDIQPVDGILTYTYLYPQNIPYILY